MVRKTTQWVQHLKLSPTDQNQPSGNVKVFREGCTPPLVILNILFSEVTALLCAFIIVYLERCYWFAAYLTLPLILKLLSIPVSIRRKGLERDDFSATEQR